MRLVKFITYILISYLCSAYLSAEENIKKILAAETQCDARIEKSFRDSLEDYLKRYINKPAEESVIYSSQEFLSRIFSVLSSRCFFSDYEEGKKLICDVKVKSVVKNIKFIALPASLLESEIRRKLPVQVGQLVELDEKFDDQVLGLSKSRVETFLRKNGYYGAIAEVSYRSLSDKMEIEIEVALRNGAFARVHKVSSPQESVLSERVVRIAYSRMCLSFNRIFNAISMGTLACYSRELEREATESLQERLASMGYIQARVRVSRTWLDPRDAKTPADCRNSGDFSQCVELKVDIKPGPKVTWTIDAPLLPFSKSSAFSRVLGSVFAVEQFSRATTERSDDLALDQMASEDELARQVTFNEAKNLDDQEMSESAQRMKNYLANKGYPNAAVESSYVHDGTDAVRVNFTVDPGQSFFIRDIKVLPENIYNIIKNTEALTYLHKRSVFEHGYISYKEIEQKLEDLKKELVDRGFSDVNINVDLTAEDFGGVSIIFYITAKEGEKLSAVIIENGNEYINKKIINLLKNCSNFKENSGVNNSCNNSYYLPKSIADDEAKLAFYYQSFGYLYARAKSKIIRNKDKIILIYRLYDSRKAEDDESPLVIQNIKGLIISGNETTNKSVIERTFPKKKASQELDPAQIRQGIAILRESGRFSRIDDKLIAAENNSDDAYYALRVVERPSFSLDNALSFSTDQFFMLETEIEENNLFSSMLKLNTSLGLGLFWGRRSIFSNRFTWPFIFGKALQLNLHAPIIVYEDKTHQIEPYRRLQSRIMASLEWRPVPVAMPYIRYLFGYTLEQKFDPNRFVAPSLKEQFATLDGIIPTVHGDGQIRGVIKPGISLARVDNRFEPRLGFDLDQWVEISGGPFVGNPPFVNLGSDNRFYLPLGPLTFALRLTIMRAFLPPNPHNWSELRNASSMDKLGGDRTVRGYPEGFLGDTSSTGKDSTFAGYFSNVANIEMRFPLTKGGSIGDFSGAVFADQGMLSQCSDFFSCFENGNANELVRKNALGFSLGLGLRYKLPVGPIALDYAYAPLHDRGRIHFQFGYPF
jgi:outer membrane protein assembly factor BamA